MKDTHIHDFSSIHLFVFYSWCHSHKKKLYLKVSNCFLFLYFFLLFVTIAYFFRVDFIRTWCTIWLKYEAFQILLMTESYFFFKVENRKHVSRMRRNERTIKSIAWYYVVCLSLHCHNSLNYWRYILKLNEIKSDVKSYMLSVFP